jgi:hypothetical protein
MKTAEGWGTGVERVTRGLKNPLACEVLEAQTPTLAKLHPIQIP